MSESDPVVSALHEGMRRFLDLVAHIRPDLHRYCARMTGSVADGEDIVQDTLARAYYALSEMDQVPDLRPWLFQIAHNRALDHLRRYDRRMSEPLDAVAETAADAAAGPEDLLAREQATHAALSRFVELVPAQRSAVILKDVLGHSLVELAQLLGLSEPAAKAALHRGRERLRMLAEAPPASAPSPPVVSPGVARYVALFNARDWDGVRAMLAEDVRLDLVNRVKRSGRREVSSYFGNYSAIPNWRVAAGVLDGRVVVFVFREPAHSQPDYFVELEFGAQGDFIHQIRDFRYVPYILAGLVDSALCGA